ncbi:ER membrane glycoprotein subunit of the GPI transamidase complex-like protein [Zygosaccharomyces mellis]|uniref:GPI mannosyltransferase 2 n=1 Tax=Zygosaccharomyces mellis TaxID=42258 RepID=A0A4C2E6M1_9SACH|nr:ER membrane glycoprotein subunit of the GPI transamidase complex-like protein [Zygosaccharomyces mellis]
MFSKLTCIFILCKLVQYGLVLLTPRDQFDTSTELLLARFVSIADSSKFWNTHLWNKLLSWDSVYFMKAMISADGKPAFEHEFVFSQLWIHLVRFCSPTHEFYSLLKTAIALENLLHYLAAFILYFLTVKIFSGNLKSSYAKSLAEKTSVLFIFSSAAGFLTGIYSEPLSFTLSFLGIWARQSTIFTTLPKYIDLHYSRFLFYFFSTVCFSLATLNRPNCILLGIYYVFDLWQLLKNRKYGKAFIFPFLSGGFLFLTFTLQQFLIPYGIFCPERGAWCSTQILGPFTKQSFYGFLQSHYWNVGLFRYWTFNNIPNFIFGLPNIVILLYSSVYFSKIYPYYSLKPHIWISISLVTVILLFSHVQIINRISSFIPLHLWYLADRLLKTSNSKDHNTPRGDDKIAYYYILWLIFWIPLQTILFAYFLPPA